MLTLKCVLSPILGGKVYPKLALAKKARAGLAWLGLETKSKSELSLDWLGLEQVLNFQAELSSSSKNGDIQAELGSKSDQKQIWINFDFVVIFFPKFIKYYHFYPTLTDVHYFL